MIEVIILIFFKNLPLFIPVDCMFSVLIIVQEKGEQIKPLAAKPENLGAFPGSTWRVGEKRLAKVVF